MHTWGERVGVERKKTKNPLMKPVQNHFFNAINPKIGDPSLFQNLNLTLPQESPETWKVSFLGIQKAGESLKTS